MKRILVSLCLTALVTSCSNVLMDVYDERSGGSTESKIAVTIKAVPDVVVPVRGSTPVTTAIETDQYTGTITWSPGDNPFASSTVYTATIVLTAKSGYTLKGVAQNFFTVAGAASVANDAGSGTVTAVFAATGLPADVDVVFQSAVQTGGTSATVESTALTLTFDVDPLTLAASNITVTGATKGALSGSGTTRSIVISDINVANGGTVAVTITSPSGYAITGSPRTPAVYRITVANMTIGMSYRGGKLAYILVSGDTGYDANVPHGLIAATADQSSDIIWALEAYQKAALSSDTGTAIGTGSSNTDLIVAQNGSGSGYAAGLCRAYSGGSYSDWYLPSYDELLKVLNQRSLIGGFVADDDYWSSSEYVNWDHYYANARGYESTGVYGKYLSKNCLRRVRACRSF